MPLGQHLIAEFYGVDTGLLCDAENIAALLQDAAATAGARVLQTMFHGFGPHCGVTGVVILAESHISIHTWPEHGYAAADIFMCGIADPHRAYAALQRALAPTRCELRVLARGAELPRR
jgi:S-adenosylmethionine decarboxylase